MGETELLASHVETTCHTPGPGGCPKTVQALEPGLTGVSGLWGITALGIGLAILLTETTSNTATANALCPILLAIATSAGVNPVPPIVGVCLGASMAFMLPVSTPSNAIVYGTGRVPLPVMVLSGVLLDILSFFAILLGLRVLCPLLGLA